MRFQTLLLLLLLLTAIGLLPGGSSPTLVQTKIKIHKATKQLQIIKNTKQQNNYKTIKISTQTEHSKYKYRTYYKNTHTHTHILQNV